MVAFDRCVRHDGLRVKGVELIAQGAPIPHRRAKQIMSCGATTNGH